MMINLIGTWGNILDADESVVTFFLMSPVFSSSIEGNLSLFLYESISLYLSKDEWEYHDLKPGSDDLFFHFVESDFYFEEHLILDCFFFFFFSFKSCCTYGIIWTFFFILYSSINHFKESSDQSHHFYDELPMVCLLNDFDFFLLLVPHFFFQDVKG